MITDLWMDLKYVFDTLRMSSIWTQMRHQKASSAWYKIIILSHVGNSLAEIMSSSYQQGHQEGHTSIILQHIWGQ